MSDIRPEMRYTEEHEWALLTAEGVIRVGITDHAQCSLGDIVYVDLPSVGTPAAAFAPIGTIESVKTVSDLFSPVNGVIVNVNPALQSAPELVNEQPYDAGWLIEIRPAGDSQEALKRLLSADQYRSMLNIGP
ncbi:glycine cleavage system protein GcvH [Paenibacillus xylaniclasticus]|uniref:glycine cleavage system protein GcvH n=1 Tax=Paenibacillus xylaniclasticus TaxID=588083 RepID=UPI000FDCADDC|nr:MULTISPECIES: glycine cleavage system protein GcvH [Paenibacillus]GFN31528.1 glycine cleavage system H protein [Paenibacillus curdlanolyticus]